MQRRGLVGERCDERCHDTRGRTAVLAPGEGVHVTTSAVMGPYVIAIDHVGVAVPDLEAAKAWYLERLGFPCVHEEVNEEQGVREAMLAVGGSGSYVQLLAPLSDDSTIARFLDRHGPGVQQVAYRVRDLDRLCTELRARGARLLYDEPRRGTSASRVNFIHPKDAGGVLIELVEPAG